MLSNTKAALELNSPPTMLTGAPGRDRQPTLGRSWLDSPRTSELLTCLRIGALHYACSLLVVVLGVLLGYNFIAPKGPQAATSVIGSVMSWDCGWYAAIVRDGYSYHPDRPSSIAFFPAYPMLARMLFAAGFKVSVALLLISHVCLVGCFVLLARYVRHRFPDASPRLTDAVLLSFGLMPYSFHFRLAYSESLFLLIALAAIYGMEKKWPLWQIALLIGLGTATRPVGIGLLLPLAVHVWNRSQNSREFWKRLVVLTPLSIWGIAGFMLYQHQAFGEPLAFMQTQQHWGSQPPSLAAKVTSLAKLEPVWDPFVRTASQVWREPDALLKLPFLPGVANRVFFVAAIASLAIGIFKRWLTLYECALCASLIMIPYLTKAYEAGVSARFAAVVFPVFIVQGLLLHRMPRVANNLFPLMSFLLGCYAALFVAGYAFT